MSKTFHVVDLFAGPGGLAEGFSAYRDGTDHQPFNVVLSVEKERSAHSTLRLRSFLRQFDGELPPEYYAFLNTKRDHPDWSNLYPEEWANACEEALQAELGTRTGHELVHSRLESIIRVGAPTVVIGGPPCQAYSLVGRARNQGKADYIPEDDNRHFLYQEYISILAKIHPVAFVMENVKGMLSSSLSGSRIFDTVLRDLRNAGAKSECYKLFAVARDPAGRMILQEPDGHSDYILMSEKFGVPQARHRVIIVGIRRDVASKVERTAPRLDQPPRAATVRHVLSGMPKLRSGLTRDDSRERWAKAVREQMERVCAALEHPNSNVPKRVHSMAEAARDAFAFGSELPPRDTTGPAAIDEACPAALAEWIGDELLTSTANHTTRAHMPDDFCRYFFCAVFSQAMGRSPKAREFPPSLAPQHANWRTGAFADRFRAQPWDVPATTVTSHIAKDGHYFIHPDPQQCRALTVREAARLQTFPDNYLFLGNRTEQYVQVGNAVPPFMARQIAAALWSVLSVPEAEGASQSRSLALAR
jgi:DNA (cytosine-5)-methyltransferase 1